MIAAAALLEPVCSELLKLLALRRRQNIAQCKPVINRGLLRCHLRRAHFLQLRINGGVVRIVRGKQLIQFKSPHLKRSPVLNLRLLEVQFLLMNLRFLVSRYAQTLAHRRAVHEAHLSEATGSHTHTASARPPSSHSHRATSAERAAHWSAAKASTAHLAPSKALSNHRPTGSASTGACSLVTKGIARAIRLPLRLPLLGGRRILRLALRESREATEGHSQNSDHNSCSDFHWGHFLSVGRPFCCLRIAPFVQVAIYRALPPDGIPPKPKESSNVIGFLRYISQ